MNDTPEVHTARVWGGQRGDAGLGAAVPGFAAPQGEARDTLLVVTPCDPLRRRKRCADAIVRERSEFQVCPAFSVPQWRSS